MIPRNRLRPALFGCALISLLLFAGMLLVRTHGSTSSSRTYVVFLVNVMLVVSLQTFIGNSGIVSFGHVAFMGIGAYMTALVTILSTVKAAQLPDLPSVLGNANLGLVPAIVVSALAALIVAAVFGGAIIRMTESTMAMATLALLVMVHTFFQNATTYTRGAVGLAGIPVRTTIEAATLAAMLFLLISRLYKESGPGLRLRATREDPLSAASVGTHVVRTRYGVWLLSAAMMGAAGSLWAQSVIAFNANQFYFSITFALLAMLVVGGRTSLTGAVAGAAIITFLTDTLARRARRADLVEAEAVAAAAPVRGPDALGSAASVLRGVQVAKHFEGVRALAGVDIDVRPGEILGLIGPNGSGKTTLLNVISGVYAPSEGHIVFRDQEIIGKEPHQVAGLGLARTFQSIRLFAQLTVRENVEAALPPGTNAGRVDGVLSWFGLEAAEGEKAVNLPYGMQRRLEIARAVVRRPSLILLDEPAAGMNEAESDELLENIQRIRSSLDCSVVVVDHDLRLIMKLCDRIQVLDQGRTIALGLPREIAEDPAVIAAYLGGPSKKSA